MNTRFKLVSIFFILIGSENISAQTQTRAGFLPSINYNHEINNVWEVNFKIESRHFVYENNTFETNNFKYKYSLSDISALAGKKVGLNSKVVMGFLTRIDPDAISYRTIQQFVLLSKLENFRIAHRIATDQTFSSIESTEFRLRYRLSAEVPLSGLSVDVKEYYFKFNTEVLNSVMNHDYDLEIRVVPNLGYLINKQHKIEFGLDNRFVSVIDSKNNFTTWITINWFF